MLKLLRSINNYHSNYFMCTRYLLTCNYRNSEIKITHFYIKHKQYNNNDRTIYNSAFAAQNS